jgi:hypothetical protein
LGIRDSGVSLCQHNVAIGCATHCLATNLQQQQQAEQQQDAVQAFSHTLTVAVVVLQDSAR